MAYISAAEVKEIRDNIKAAYPVKDGWKWSVRGHNHSSVKASLMAYPKGYKFPGHSDVNYYYIDRMENVGEKEKEVLTKVKEILFAKHWDESDIMTDYFNCAFYVSMEIGRWNKDAVMVEPKVKRAPKKAAPKPAPLSADTATVLSEYSEREVLDLAAFVGIVF